MLLAIDKKIFLLINGLQGHPWVDHFFSFITLFGTFWLCAPLLTVTLLLLHRRRAVKALVMSYGIALSVSLIGQALKHTIARSRPTLELAESVKLLTRDPPYYLSFPSGHALTAFIVLGLVWVIDRRLFWPWAPFAFLVLVSRIYLGVHYPSDVVFGAALGFSLSWSLASRFKSMRLYPADSSRFSL